MSPWEIFFGQCENETLKKSIPDLNIGEGNYYFIISKLKHMLCAQKNRLSETVLLSTQNMFKLIDKQNNCKFTYSPYFFSGQMSYVMQYFFSL